MTPEELKISIFHCAMQGKLVEQRESEGTASDLYEEILKVAKKDKNVTPIQEDDIPFEIPSSWRWCRFGEITDCSMGKTPPRAEAVWWGEDIPWVSISDMTDYGHVIETKERVSQKALEEKFGAISKAGTLLMSFKLTVGRTSILDIDALHNEAIISIFPYVDKNEYFRDYLFYILPIITQWGESKNAIKGKTLNRKSIANLLVPLAPLEEQHRIVAKIEELLPYVDRYAEAYEKLEQFNAKFPEDMKKSILQYAIQGKLVEQRPEEGTAEELYQLIQEEKQRLIKEGKIKKDKPLAEISEEEVPFDIPDTWKWVKIASIVSKLTDGSHNPPPNSGIGYPVISAKNVRNGKIILENVDRYTDEEGFQKENPRTNITRNDVIMGIIGGSIGNIAIYNHDEKVIAQRSIAIIKPMIDTLYFTTVLQSPFIQNLLKVSTAGSAQGGVYLGTLKELLFPLPPLEEQKRIIAKIEELLPYCEKLK